MKRNHPYHTTRNNTPRRKGHWRRVAVFCLLTVAAVLTACSEKPKAIPDHTMRSIMREMLISQAVLRVDKSLTADKPLDSLDVHTAVLQKYGYTLEDFRYTIREMSMRKSNPLANILEGVAADIKRSSEVAEGRYRQMLRIDSMAQARTCDTVFRSDTTLVGSLHNYKIVYTGVNPSDSLVPVGTYKIMFDYSTGSHARSYTKSLRSKKTPREGKAIENTIWLQTARDTTHYESEIDITTDTKQLDIWLQEIQRRDIPKDTCYLTGVRLIYYRPAQQARAILLRRFTGFPDQLEAYYEQRYTDTTSLPRGTIPFAPRR